MTTIAERLKIALERIAIAECDANRAANSVQLLAVSKTKPVSDIEHAYENGQRMFGENYVQEGVEKVQQLQALKEIEWHFIGPMQSNKTKLVAEHFDWVQSIDRLKIAKRLNEQRSAFKPLNVCIQVNINHESSKSGILPEQVAELAQEIDTMDNLTLRGLMAIPMAAQTTEQLTRTFSQMRELFHHLQNSYPKIDTLSIGMTQDLESAIQGGSTMVRLGTAIFGSRPN